MNKRSKITLFALAVITVALIVIIAVSGSPNSDFSFAYKIFGTPVAAVQKAFSSAGSSVKGWFEFVFSYDEMKAEMDELKEENDRIALLEDEKDRLELENSELKELISLKDYSDKYSLISANIIAHDVTDWFDCYTIDVGTSDGINKNDVVVTSSGLVGIVNEAGFTSSKIMTVVNEQNSFMCRISRSNELVRVRGVSGETLKYELVVDRLAEGSSVFKGDKIVTAESGDVYPAGIMVGTVSDVTVNEKNGEVSATIDLAVDLKVVSKVYVMVPEADKNAKETENS